MHDYFDILGVARDARPTDIRRACRRRVPTSHPDVWDGDTALGARRAAAAVGWPPAHELSDAAIDFVDAAAFVDSMRAAFFGAAGRKGF